MKIRSGILLALAAALLAGGCCPCRSYQKKTRRPLEGTAWRLIQLDGRPVRPEADEFTLTFIASDKRLTGVGSCNRLTAPYTAGEKRSLRIGAVAATRMACPDAQSERAFIAALESATHYDMDGPMLLLLADGELRALFQAVP